MLLCRKKDTKQLFAIKALDKQRVHAANAEYVLAESEALQQLHHPFIMKMHGAFQDAQHFFFVFEYAGGGDLFEHVRVHSIFPVAWAKFYAAQVALALEHIHSKGFLYRDLKLENVLVSEAGHAKLGDFGLAKKMTEAQEGDGGKAQSLRDSMAGTELAMAPEVLSGDEYGVAIDWWSLGVLLCEMHLGGTPMPVIGKDATLLSLMKIFREERHLERLEPGIDPAMRGAMVGLLTVDVERRIHSLAMLQTCELFESFEWEPMFKLELVPPLAPYLQKRARGYSTTPAAAEHRPHLSASNASNTSKSSKSVSELSDVEKRFNVFMEADVQTEASDELAGGGSSAAVDISSVALCDAASRGDEGALRAIHKAGGDVNQGDYDKRTAMHLAASDGLLKVLLFLVEELGARLSPVDRWGGTPLDDAIRQEHLEVVAYLRSKGATRGRVDCSSSALCEAASKGDQQTLYDIRNAGGDVDIGDYDQRTAAHLAASEGRLAMLTFLVDELGADHSPLDRWGGSPLDDALRQNHSAVVEFLVRRGSLRGSNPNAAIDISAESCARAASTGNLEKLRAIHEAGGDVNQGDYDKRTALHLSASEGHLETVQYLIDQCGANLSPVDRWGGTPYDDAVRHQHKAVSDFLASKGATPLCFDIATYALCNAAFTGNLEALSNIAEAGGNLGQGDYDQRTPLHLAASEGHFELILFLLDRDIDANPRDRWGGTPLDDAIRGNHRGAADLLVSRGGECGSLHAQLVC